MYESVIKTRRVLTCALMRECLNEKDAQRRHECKKLWGELYNNIRQGDKVPDANGRLLCAFAAICQDLGITGSDYAYWREQFFFRK